MFPTNVQKRLGLLNTGLVEVSDSCLHIVEKQTEGKADLTLNLENASILFKNLEDKKLQYFINGKCADSVLFEYNGTDWITHIFECKRSVGESEWDSIKKQFCGALQNAFALAGVLDIAIQKEQIHMYTVYRNDKLNAHANPAKMRMEMHRTYNDRNKTFLEAKKEWNEKEVLLDVAGENSYLHTKIKLDVETGTALYNVI